MNNLFEQIINLENLFESWRGFRQGKRNKLDVQIFERSLEDNFFKLHQELKDKTYRHFDYTSFYITDPKLRHIHKACVKDRVLHHAVYQVLYPIFDRRFIYDSYSCRLGKGTHKAVYRLEIFARKVSKNYTKVCFVLKCDIKKFFDSVDQEILLKLVEKRVVDKNALCLIEKIIRSFNNGNKGRGLPIGNLTSQLFANIYLDELDKFIKHKLQIKYYLRYCDDFLILDSDWEKLNSFVEKIDNFLQTDLKLALSKNKIIILKLRQGIDFLGYLTLPYYRVLRTKTKKRIFKKVNSLNLFSYLGLLKHCNGYKIKQELVRWVDI